MPAPKRTYPIHPILEVRSQIAAQFWELRLKKQIQCSNHSRYRKATCFARGRAITSSSCPLRFHIAVAEYLLRLPSKPLLIAQGGHVDCRPDVLLEIIQPPMTKYEKVRIWAATAALRTFAQARTLLGPPRQKQHRKSTRDQGRQAVARPSHGKCPRFQR